MSLPESDDKTIWWCNSHNRIATHLDDKSRHCCNPNLGGILIPCRCVELSKEEFQIFSGAILNNK